MVYSAKMSLSAELYKHDSLMEWLPREFLSFFSYSSCITILTQHAENELAKCYKLSISFLETGITVSACIFNNITLIIYCGVSAFPTSYAQYMDKTKSNLEKLMLSRCS